MVTAIPVDPSPLKYFFVLLDGAQTGPSASTFSSHIGNNGGNFNDGIIDGVEPGHFQVDPDQSLFVFQHAIRSSISMFCELYRPKRHLCHAQFALGRYNRQMDTAL